MRAAMPLLCRRVAFADRHPHNSGIHQEDAMGFKDPVSLRGRHVSLVPLSHSHHDALVEALKDGELWGLWYTKIPAPEGPSHSSAGARLSGTPKGDDCPSRDHQPAADQDGHRRESSKGKEVDQLPDHE